ncbi:integrase family protein [Sulfitobacter sp. OXR-159]|uniref:tyrosine-type recombinase/integrase n=1 Tax=Sulfitobacter sp. OXR-159 TaxID=3100174 RepID=UPI002AC8CC29|nr:integrase family protein [Sulfitobacter sp. OXR-159]WPZ28505.1 integrase family protein [Sulfitobacter sp. OXR-159]
MKSTQPLTDRLIQNIKADTGRIQITDARTQGLKLRVSRTGHKSFAVMMRNKAGKYTTITIGTYPDLSLKEAREVACQIRVDMKTKGLEKPRTSANSKVGKITLRELLDEVQPVFAHAKKGWRPRGGPGSSAYTRNTIERVFGPLLDKPVERLTPEDFGRAANGYQPVRPLKGKDTANGQVSRALSYLSPVLDWAAHRGRKFDKIGAGRATRLDVAELRRVHDPATNDPTIKGKRQRVLSVEEIAAIFPLLQYPAPQKIRRRNILPKNDFGPAAMRFLLLTLARREEVANARWSDIDFTNGVWVKHDVKDTTGKGRSQRLPLSNAALDFLRYLPGYLKRDGNALVFPNRDGGKLDNWNRIAEQIQKGSNTRDWTRHDLRRTGATLLEELQVPVQTIEAILDHSNRFANAGVSGSAGHYMVATRILNKVEDPKLVALNKLSAALDHIVADAKSGGDTGRTDAPH